MESLLQGYKAREYNRGNLEPILSHNNKYSQNTVLTTKIKQYLPSKAV